MNNLNQKRFAVIGLVACLSIQPVIQPARADVAGSMKDFWEGVGASNYTGPTAAQGQTAGYYTGGNIFMRTRAMNTQLATINLPSYRAGCGGIDFFAGGFSFINSDQLIALMRSIGTNAIGYAFKLALETISPMIAEQIGSLQDLIQRVNQASINSCETAKGIVGGLWPESDTASKVICEDLGNSGGIFTDRAASRHGCGSEGQRGSTLASASGAIKKQIVQDTNIAWEAIKNNSLLKNDTGLAELVMNLSGTIIVKAPADDDASPKFSYYSHKGDDKALITALLKGGSVTVNRCVDTTDCLEINKSATLTVSATGAYSQRVEELLESMQEKAATDSALSDAEKDLLNLTNIPIYKVINIQTAYRGALGGLTLPQYADLIATDILYQYLSILLKEIEKGGNTLSLASNELLRDWKAEIRAAQRALREEIRKVSKNFNQLVSITDNIRLLEQQLVGSLSAGIRSNVSFLSGGTD